MIHSLTQIFIVPGVLEEVALLSEMQSSNIAFGLSLLIPLSSIHLISPSPLNPSVEDCEDNSYLKRSKEKSPLTLTILLAILLLCSSHP